MGFNPTFSARVFGITSSASAYMQKQWESIPVVSIDSSLRRNDAFVLAALPPAMRNRSLNRDLATTAQESTQKLIHEIALFS
jgi:hypothetical protein